MVTSEPRESDGHLSREAGSEGMRGLLATAASLLPQLKERAASAEDRRRLPAESIADLREAGLFRIAVPARYGGLCDDLDLMYDVGWELGRACGSTAWC